MQAKRRRSELSDEISTVDVVFVVKVGKQDLFACIVQNRQTVAKLFCKGTNSVCLKRKKVYNIHKFTFFAFVMFENG